MFHRSSVRALAILAAALITASCGMFQGKATKSDRATPAAATAGTCRQEGESCAAKGDMCCRGLVCIGITESFCASGT